MKLTTTKLESERLRIQAEIDATKSQVARNKLGQFATPPPLATEIARYAQSVLPPDTEISFLDPAIGTGSFYSAIIGTFRQSKVTEALGFEIDAAYAEPAIRLWEKTGLIVEVSDFTVATPSPRFNLIICNPPYVRHHHLKSPEKMRLQKATLGASGIRLGGLAGLYCHFLGLAHPWMMEGGLACWLIPSEFMDVNYGRPLKRYLLRDVTLLHIHRFDPSEVQFSDALVSSALVFFRNSKPASGSQVRFSFGGSLLAPKVSRSVNRAELQEETKWTIFPNSEVRGRSTAPTISDLFDIRRGIATGDNSYFILDEETITRRGLPLECFTPILPSPRLLSGDIVHARSDRTPDILTRRFVLNTRLNESEISVRYPELKAYLDEGMQKGLPNGYLCSHRSPWYAQEHRLPPPIVCTYIGRGDCKRGKPFRFILNESNAIVANVYLAMYPKPALRRALAENPILMKSICDLLNNLPVEVLTREGRVYGGGLYKLEPRELSSVAIPEIAPLLPEITPVARQSSMLAELVA